MPSTFDTFVVSATSEAAFSAAVAVAQNRGGAPNPLFLYGPTGAGKTHLLQAIAHELHAQCIPTRALITSLTEAIRSDTMDAFRESLAAQNALLLDDFPSDHPHARKEIFTIIGELVRKRVPVVIASVNADVHENAFAIEVGYPTRDAQVEILRRQASLRGLALSDEFLQSLAEQSSGNPRELQASITRIAAESLIP